MEGKDLQEESTGKWSEETKSNLENKREFEKTGEESSSMKPSETIGSEPKLEGSQRDTEGSELGSVKEQNLDPGLVQKEDWNRKDRSEIS